MTGPFSWETDVRFSDVDLYRIVWHGRYVEWLEEARNALASRAGFSLVAELDRGYRYPIVDLDLRYRRPARLGERVRVLPVYVPERIARISFTYRIERVGDDELLATATSRQVVLKGDELLVTRPASLARILEALVALQAGWARAAEGQQTSDAAAEEAR